MYVRNIVVLVAVLGLVACGGGGGSSNANASRVSLPPPAPELSALTPSSITLELEQSESSDETIRFSNSGSGVLTYSLSLPSWVSVVSGADGSLAANETAQVVVRVTCDQGSQSGPIVLTTNDTDQSEISIPITLTCTQNDYEVARLVLNQATRSFDSDESDVMLIDSLAGRDLLVRVFITGSGDVPQGDVVLRSGATERRFSLNVPTSINSTPADESLLSASHYAIVPGSAMVTGSQLYVEVSGIRFPTSNLNLEVADPGPLNVTLVPVTFDGQTPTLDPDLYLRQTLQYC